MSESLYERLGGEEGISKIAHDLIARHLKNPAIKTRFQDSDTEKLHQYVVEFVGMGTGGPQKYTGKAMAEAHKGMNISDHEFMAVVDDVMAACDNNGVAPDARNEVLGILYSLRPDVVRL